MVPCLIQALKRKDIFSFFFRIGYTYAKKTNCYFLKKLKNLFKEVRSSYDIIVAYRPGICTELAAFTFEGRKKISWWHHGVMNVYGSSREELHAAYKKIDTIVAVSKSSSLIVEETFPDIKEKVTVIPNMILPEKLIEKASKYEVKEFKNARLKIVSVGRMSPEKNMILCPQIAVLLRKMGLDFRWILIGDGVDTTQVSNMINKYQLNENMIMIGKKSNPYPYIEAADLMIHPSLVESQGITILESMALHTPVIAVSSEGPKEFIKTGVNGYLVNADENEVAKLVNDFYINPRLCKKIAENALVTVRRFAERNVMEKIEKVLEN